MRIALDADLGPVHFVNLAAGLPDSLGKRCAVRVDLSGRSCAACMPNLRSQAFAAVTSTGSIAVVCC
jgi:hypothetical protein